MWIDHLEIRRKKMAEFTRVNGLGHALGALYPTMQLKAFKLVPTTALTGGIGGTAEALAQEFGTTGAFIEIGASGTTALIIGDGHALDVAVVDSRAQHVLGEAVTTTEITSFYGIANS